MPSHPQPVRPVPVQKARRVSSVKIDQVAIGNNTQTAEIKIRVEALQRVERPGHLCDPLGKDKVSLCAFQPVSQTMVSILGLYSEHMRVMRCSPVLVTDKTICE